MAKAGHDTSGFYRIEFMEPITIPVEMSGTEPISYSVAHSVIDQCKAAGVDPMYFAIDTSSTQAAMADIIESEWQAGIMRVSFAGRPTDLPVSTEDQTPANQRYANRVTELWHTFYQYGRHGHIAGVGVEAIKEFCSRLLLEKLNPISVEPKRAMKARSGKSPDIADSMCILTALVRERLGIVPGIGKQTAQAKEQRETDDLTLDKPGQTYLTSPEETYLETVGPVGGIM